MKIIEITKKQNNEFVKKNKWGNMHQLSYWAAVKEPVWYSKRIGVVDENEEILGVAQLSFRKVLKNQFVFCYVNHGICCDYTNVELRKFLLQGVVDYARKEKAMVVKIDPNLKLGEIDGFIDELELSGFKHKGFTIGFGTVQPRYERVTDISPTEEEIFKGFDYPAKRGIKTAKKYGITFEKGSIKDIDEFYKIMQETTSRDKFPLYRKNFFKRILEEYNDDGGLFLTKIYPSKTLEIVEKEKEEVVNKYEKIILKKNQEEKLKNQKESCEARIVKLNKLIEELKQVQDKNEIILTGAITIFCSTEAYYLYGGSSNMFRTLCPNYLMMWEMMRYSKIKEKREFNFGGVKGPGAKNNSLEEFKKKFNSELIEKYGEFDKTLKPIRYFLFSIALKVYESIAELKNKLK